MKPYYKNLFRVLRKPSLLCNTFWRDDVVLPITTWFNPRQKWLTDVIPTRWCDKTELITMVNFAILIDFVEGENGLDQLYIDWDEQLKGGFIGQEYVDNVKHVYGELRDVYYYIKTERASLQKRLNDSYPPYPDTRALTYEAAYGETNRLEAEIEERDTWALHKIAEHRGVLWT